MFDNLFAVVLNMSITATVAVALIIFIRWIIGKKLPAIFRYALWGIVLVRLVLPLSIPSIFSIFNAIPVSETATAQRTQYEYSKAVSNIQHETGSRSLNQDGTANDALNNNFIVSLPAAVPEAPIDPIQALMQLIPWVWLIAVAGLFIFNLYAYFHATCKLKEAVLYKDDDLISQCKRKLKMNLQVQVYTSDKVHTPVVFGLIKPRIILPINIAEEHNDTELKYILTHELVHIKRFDYIIKLISVLALCIHWFNPAVWLSFILSHKDMEMSCDEKVMSVFDNDIRSDYASSLIKIAEKQNMMLNGGLLAFGENNIKSRIKGIMNFKKPSFWIGATIAAITIVIGSVLLTDAQYKEVTRQGIIAEGTKTQLENNEGANIAFDKSKIQEYGWLETVIINNCLGKDGPGEDYESVHNLKYGDIVFVTGKYNNWLFCTIPGDKVEFWVETKNLIDEQRHNDYNLGVVIANEVTVGTVTLKKGNLIQVLKRDQDKSCVTIRVIDINAGKTGWISNSDYVMANTEVFYNQAYLKKGTVIYEEPSVNAQKFKDFTGEYELFVNIDKEQDGWVYISTYGPIYGWVPKENIFIPVSSLLESKNTQVSEIKFTDVFNGNIISPNITGNMKNKLLGSIAAMKEMGPGVGPWKIIYCNGDKIILYNYAHIIACDITEKGKGIYSIIDLRGLKTGNYQGSIIAMVYPSPDAMSCILGAGCWENDIELHKSLYICNFTDGSVKELETNYNMANDKVTWYRNLQSSGPLPWYVSIEANDSGIIWDIENDKKIDSIPADSRPETIVNHFVESIDIKTEYTYLYWWKADENTVIGAPYSKDKGNFSELKLTDFEIIEVNLKDKSGKILYKINS